MNDRSVYYKKPLTSKKGCYVFFTCVRLKPETQPIMNVLVKEIPVTFFGIVSSSPQTILCTGTADFQNYFTWFLGVKVSSESTRIFWFVQLFVFHFF